MFKLNLAIIRWVANTAHIHNYVARIIVIPSDYAEITPVFTEALDAIKLVSKDFGRMLLRTPSHWLRSEVHALPIRRVAME